MNTKIIPDVRRRLYKADAKTIQFWRDNPCIAARDLLGIELFDAQKYMLQGMWNATQSVLCCSRDLGKSFLGAVFMILKALLYENQAIYIVSSVGNQSKETFTKIEEIVSRIGKTAASIRSLKDIAQAETKKSAANKTGFSHDPTGYSVEFFNGSAIYTLNSKPDNARSRRATLVFFDEAAFCSDELIIVCEAFAVQSTDFITDTNSSYDPTLEPRRVPTQLVYASSQDRVDTLFYKHYKDFSKKMLAGDMTYFVCDMNCEIGLTTYMNGKKYRPIITKGKVDAAITADRDRAMREYYNQPTIDGGVTQIVKWGQIRRNETFALPEVVGTPGYKYVLAFDPARTIDNSVISTMKLVEDPDLGLCGDIVNCVNMVDVATKRKLKLDSNRQIAMIREMLLDYNGKNPDYEFIDRLLIDAGSGGGGVTAYGDQLLNDWTDRAGKHHRGLIDLEYELYETYGKLYPNAVDQIRLINPRKYKVQMVQEFLELMRLGVIRFPYDLAGKDYINVVKKEKNGTETMEMYALSFEEQLALVNIELMKKEITSIHRYTNQENTTVSYALAKNLENKMHDDRFYTIIMLAHRLYELRRGQIIKTKEPVKDYNGFMFRAPKLMTRR